MSGTWAPAVLRAQQARARQSFVTAGHIVVMTAEAIRYLVTDVLRGRFQVTEFVAQAWFMARVSVAPTLLVAVPFGVTIAIQIGSLAQQLGATSFVGAANGMGVLRQGAPLVVALLMAGAVGSAIASDLGARTIREEIDAMEVLGIPPIQRLVVPRVVAAVLIAVLVVPRVVAAVLIAVLLCAAVAFAGLLTGLLFNLIAQGGTPGGYITSFASFAQPSDLVLAEIKSAIFGFLVAVVACYKGLTAKGGPKGVADAVNATVVLSVVLLFAVNVIGTEIYAVLIPQRLA